MMRPIGTGLYGLHNFMPDSLTGGGNPYDISVSTAVMADEQGYDWVLLADATDSINPSQAWTPDISDLFVDAPNPDANFTMEPVIASAGPQTKNVKFLWGPVDVVRRAPVNIAQMVNTLSYPTRGRMNIILAQGQQDHMRQYGISRKGTADKLWDGTQIVRTLIRQTEPFSYRGRVWQFDNGALGLPYFGDQPPAVWVAGGSEESLRLIGEHADGWVDCIPGMDDCDPAVFAGKIARIAEHARGVGRDPSQIGVLTIICSVMTDDEDALERLVEHPIIRWATMLNASAQTFNKLGHAHPYGHDWNYFRDCIPEWISKREYLELTSRVTGDAIRGLNFFGTADQVFRQLEPWIAAGLTEVVIYNPAALCGSEYLGGVFAANDRLIKQIRTVEVSGPT
jgi:alkanesulfonate monooxygenase SsuD/methylene tetrahydromethanopterin reductase-like flavin-dependent oxidoreductase (luciferase family)